MLVEYAESAKKVFRLCALKLLFFLIQMIAAFNQDFGERFCSTRVGEFCVFVNLLYVIAELEKTVMLR